MLYHQHRGKYTVYLTVILRTRVVYELIADEARYQPCTTRVSGITVLLYTQALDIKQLTTVRFTLNSPKKRKKNMKGNIHS